MIKRRWLSLSIFYLTACQAPPVPVGPTAAAPAPAMAIDVAAFETALAEARSVDWSSRTFASPRILEAQQRLASRSRGYRVNYAGWPAAAAWTRPHAGVQISNSPAYAFSDPVWNTGPNPMAGDRVMYMTNAPLGVAGFFVVNPATGAPLNGTGWDVLTAVGAAAGAKVDNSALTVSTKGTQAMFVTVDGYFGAIDTATGAKKAGFSLGAGRLTVRSAPFINNSANPGIDDQLQVWCATTDGTDSVGQLHRLGYTRGAAPEWTLAPAVTVSGASADGTGGARTARGFKTSPVAWGNKVYIGDTGGLFWEYDLATNSARYWDLSPFSGVASNQILAPAAFDLGTGDQVNRIFVACGGRVFWIDPLTNVMVPSQMLVLDTATSTPGPKLQGSLNGYTFTGTTEPDIRAATSISVGSNFNVGSPAYAGYEITGSDGLNTPTDGRPVSGYVRFNVPGGAFGGRLPISATLTMTVDPYCIPDGSDAGSIFRASNFLKNPTTGQDTTTIWNQANLAWQNQPRLLVPTAFSQRSGPAAQFAQVTWNISGAIPRDGDNYTFVMRGAGKQYNGTACASMTSPGYYGYAIGTAAYRPYIRVTTSSNGLKGAILNQPVLLSLGTNPRLFVSNSNALFELNYQSTGTFASAAETYFSLNAAGRGGAGNVGVLEPGSKYRQNPGALALGMDAGGAGYYLYASDDNGTGVPHIGKYGVPLNRTVNADSLLNVYNLPAGTSRPTTHMTWDYFGGSLYFADQGTTTSTFYRIKQ